QRRDLTARPPGRGVQSPRRSEPVRTRRPRREGGGVARTNDEVARLLNELAVLTEIDEGSPQAFRVRAYQNAARAVAGLTRDVATMSATELADVRGLGKSTAARIREYVDTGTIAKVEQLRAKHPVGKR